MSATDRPVVRVVDPLIDARGQDGPPIGWRWVGRVPYREALDWQRERREAVIAGNAPEVLALLEHPRVITTGRRGGGDLDGVRAAGIPIVETERGGLATWHGPGQLVGYAIVDVERRRIGVRRFVALVEDVLIGFLRDADVPAQRRPGAPGVFVRGQKIGSVGLHFRKGVSLHGFSLNLCNSLDDFALFDACGLAGVTATNAAAHDFQATPAGYAANVAVRFTAAVDTHHDKN